MILDKEMSASNHVYKQLHKAKFKQFISDGIWISVIKSRLNKLQPLLLVRLTIFGQFNKKENPREVFFLRTLEEKS